MWWWWWVLLLNPLPDFSVGQEPPKKMIGTEGESVTFPLEMPQSFLQILWHRKEAHVATLRPGPPCRLRVFSASERQQMKVSKDCSALTVMNLSREDSGAYQAQTLISGEPFSLQNFYLQVYKNLLKADLEIVCAKDVLRDGNETYQLNCSAENWDDVVRYSWTSGSEREILSLGNTFAVPHSLRGDNQTITCIAENPASNTSKTVSLQQICGKAPPSGQPSAMLIGITVAILLLAKVAISTCVFVKWPPHIKRDHL